MTPTTANTIKQELLSLNKQMEEDLNRVNEALASLEASTTIEERKKQLQERIQGKAQTIRRKTHQELQDLLQEFEATVGGINKDVAILFNNTVKKLEKIKAEQLRNGLKK